MLSKQNPQVTRATQFAIFGTAGLAFCGVLVETSLNVTFPTLMRTFGTSLGHVQWVTTAYLLAVAVAMVITAFVQARFKTRTILLSAGVFFVLGGTLCASAPSLSVLLVGRIIQAFGTGFAMPLVFALIMHQVPVRQQGQYTGTAGMLIALAPSLGPTYGGIVNQLTSWRLIFVITIPIAVLACGVAVAHVQQPTTPHPVHFPWDQFLLIIATFVTLTLGINSLGTSGFTSPNCWVLLILAIATLWLFIQRALHSSQPLINLAVFRNHGFGAVLTIYFLIQFIQIGLTFLLPNYTQLALGINSMISGTMLLMGSLASVVLSPFAGRLMDQAGIRLPLRIGSGFLLVATVLFAICAQHLTIVAIVVIFTLYSIGFSFMFNNLLTYGLQLLPKEQFGDGNALFNTLQQYAGSLGTAIMATLLALGSDVAPHTSPSTQTVAGTQLAFIWAVVIIAIASWLALRLSRNQPHR